MLDIVFLLLGLILLLNFIKIMIKSRAPLKKAAGSMLAGIAALAAACLLTGFSGFAGPQVAVNICTVFISLTLGVPGVALIITKLFFI